MQLALILTITKAFLVILGYKSSRSDIKGWCSASEIWFSEAWRSPPVSFSNTVRGGEGADKGALCVGSRTENVGVW